MEEGLCSDGQGRELVCEVCKVAPAKVFSATERQVYCWKCDEAAHRGESLESCPRYLILGSPLPAVSQRNDSDRGASFGEIGPPSNCPMGDGFACWPSDSEESLLVEFKQGLAPGITGDSEIMQIDWLSGGSLLKPAGGCKRDICKDHDATSGGMYQSLDGLEKPLDNGRFFEGVKQECVTDGWSEPIAAPAFGQERETPILPVISNTEPTNNVAYGGNFGPLPFGIDLVTQKLPGMVVPGAPYGMIPVTMPATHARRHSAEGFDPDVDVRRQARKRRMSIREEVDPSVMPVVSCRPARTKSSPAGFEMMVAQNDIIVGASSGPQRRCTHCGASKTPQWRAGPFGQKTLCNACGVKYKAGRLTSCGSPSGRGRRVSQLASQRKAVVASEGRGS